MVFAASCCFWIYSSKIPNHRETIEKLENKSPNDCIFVEISKFQICCDFWERTSHKVEQQKQKRKNLDALARVWATSRPTNFMRFPAPTKAPRENELHLGCYTCWLSQPLETNYVHHIKWETVLYRSLLQVSVIQKDETFCNQKNIETINLHFLTNFEFSLKFQSPTLIPVASVSSHDDGWVFDQWYHHLGVMRDRNQSNISREMWVCWSCCSSAEAKSRHHLGGFNKQLPSIRPSKSLTWDNSWLVRCLGYSWFIKFLLVE